MMWNQILAGFALGLCLLAATGIGQDFLGQGTKPDGAVRKESEGYIDYTFNPKGISLEDAVHWATRDTKRSFKYNAHEFQNKPNLILTGPVRIEQGRSYEFWQSLFLTANFAMVPMGPGEGDFVQLELIDTSRILKQRATFVPVERIAEYRYRAGEVIMTTIALNHIKVESIRGALQQMFANRATEFANEVPTANAVLVVGFGPTIYAIHQTLRAMDVPATTEPLRFEMIALEHASAEQVRPIIAELIAKEPSLAKPTRTAPAGAGEPPFSSGREHPEPKLIADPQSNSLVVYAVESNLNEIKRLAAALDKNAAEVNSNVRIHRLKYRSAHSIAQTLRDILKPDTEGNTKGPESASPEAEAAGSRAEISVVADEGSNSLLIRASRTRYEELKRIIDELDQLRPGDSEPDRSKLLVALAQDSQPSTAKVEEALSKALGEVEAASMAIGELSGWIQKLMGLSVVVDGELRARWESAPESIAIAATQGLKGRELLALIADQLQISFVIREYGLFMVPINKAQFLRPAKSIP